MARLRDISQQRFGSLVAQKVAGKDSTGKTLWACKCDCGNSSRHTMLNLVKGTAKSCGCARFRPSESRRDLANEKFGRLQPLRPVDSLRWACVCDCGQTTTVRTVHLTRGHTRSCGCLARQPDTKRRAQYATRNARTTWAKEVRSRAPAHCETCGSDEDLHVHHIVPFAQNAALAYEVENGVVLCQPCHRQVHKRINAGCTPGAALIQQYQAKSTCADVQSVAQLLLERSAAGLHRAREQINRLIERTQA